MRSAPTTAARACAVCIVHHRRASIVTVMGAVAIDLQCRRSPPPKPSPPHGKIMSDRRDAAADPPQKGRTGRTNSGASSASKVAPQGTEILALAAYMTLPSSAASCGQLSYASGPGSIRLISSEEGSPCRPQQARRKYAGQDIFSR